MSGGVTVAVLGRPQDVPVVACAAAVELARAGVPRTALVVAVGAFARAGLPGPPASGPARALRDRLVSRGLPARAAGRLVWCTPPGADPVREVRLAAACGRAVLAICGPREEPFEPLLREAALVLVAGSREDGPTSIALAGLRAEHPHAAAAVTRPAGAPGLLARAGLGGAAAWERPVRDLLAGLP